MKQLKKWLESYPNWGQRTLLWDSISPKPGSCGLFPRGTEMTCEGKLCHYQKTFLLRVMAVAGDRAAFWLEELAGWINNSAQTGNAPALGQGKTLWSARKGTLAKTDPSGLGTYELTITAVYEKTGQREETDVYQINGKPLLVPDGPVEATFSDVEAEGSGIDESGFFHRIPLRWKRGQWKFTYKHLTVQDYSYLQSLIGGQESFVFVRPRLEDAGGWAHSLCHVQECQVSVRESGLWDLTFRVEEC